MELSSEIKLIRQKALLTQESFAKELGVAFTTVNRWEMGKIKPGISAVKKIKTFCINNNISFEGLENAWFSSSEVSKDGNK